VINFLVHKSGEAIEDEWVDDKNISKEDEIMDDFEGL
jgi:hypothetical protein